MASDVEAEFCRLARRSPQRTADGDDHGRWSIPIVADGSPARLSGEIRRVHPPPLWLWLLCGVPFAAVAVLSMLRPRAWLHVGSLGFAALAAAASLATVAGFVLDASASPAKWVQGGNEAVFAFAGLVAMAVGPPAARIVGAAGLGLLGLFVGLVQLDVLTHGVVLSLLPADAARSAAAVAIWAGAAAVATTLPLIAPYLEAEESRWLEP